MSTGAAWRRDEPLGLTTGAGALSAFSADRGVTIPVAEDGEAFLGVDRETKTTDGTTVLTVRVTNQYPAGTTLSTVAVTVGGKTKQLVTGNRRLEPGEAAWKTFGGVDCGVPIRIEASGEGVDVTIDRTVECS